MDEMLKRKQKQSMVDAANMGDDNLSASISNVFGGNAQQQAQRPLEKQVSDKAYSEAAERNALQHKMFMLQQIAAERARGPVDTPEPYTHIPDMDPAELAKMANSINDAVPSVRFPNLKKPRGK